MTRKENSEREKNYIDKKKLGEFNSQAWAERVKAGQTDVEFDVSSYLVNQGFEVIKADLPDNITGILLIDERDENNPLHVIAIKDGKNKPQSRFIAAHEYAHVKLHKNGLLQYAHRDYETLVDSEQEQEAEAFARCFLMPEQLVRPLCFSFKTDRDILEKITTREDFIELVRSKFNVTVKKAKVRIEELKICEELGIN